MEAIHRYCILPKYYKFMLIFGLLVNQALACSFFTCKDSSKVIPADFVNDNFCDCKDGSDEPNTSACPNNFFKCPGLKIPSSKVQDSVCGTN